MLVELMNATATAAAATTTSKHLIRCETTNKNVLFSSSFTFLF